MRAIIPVAGVGTRLRPHTYSLPKVLLNVAGKPILAHIMDNIIEQGITRATLITGYLGDLVEEYVRKRYNIDVEFVDQKETLGLGHAIWMGRSTYGDEPLIIILGDTIFELDLDKVKNFGNSSIGVKYVEDPRRFGVVVPDDDGLITKFVEKPEVPISHLAIVGLYYVKEAQELMSALTELINNDIKTRGEYQLTDALQLMLDKGIKFSTFKVDGWFDCGKPETMLATNRYLLDKIHKDINIDGSVIIPPVYIAEDAVVVNSVIGPYASLASGAEVKDSVVKDSILSDGAKVYSGLLKESIIGNNATVKGHFNRLNMGSSSELDYR